MKNSFSAHALKELCKKEGGRRRRERSRQTETQKMGGWQDDGLPVITD